MVVNCFWFNSLDKRKMIVKSKVEISPGNFFEVDTEIPEWMIVLILTGLGLSIYNLLK